MFKRLQHLIHLDFVRTARISAALLLASTLLFATSLGAHFSSSQILQDTLRENPTLTVDALVAMLQAFIALVLFTLTHDYQSGEKNQCQLILLILLCCELLLMHPLGIAVTALLLYLLVQAQGMQVIAPFKQPRTSRLLIRLVATVAILLLAVLVAWVKFRLM